jgi:hypothetical protein
MNGEIRAYIFIGIIFGVLLYMLTFSKIVIKVSVKIIDVCKMIIAKIVKVLAYPFCLFFKIIKKVLFRPISFICINIRTFIIKNINRVKVFPKFSKKLQK